MHATAYLFAVAVLRKPAVERCQTGTWEPPIRTRIAIDKKRRVSYELLDRKPQDLDPSFHVVNALIMSTATSAFWIHHATDAGYLWCES